MRQLLSLFTICLLAVLTAACGDKKTESQQAQEDRQAKQLLQGIWLDESEQDVIFKVVGDTIYYPDSTSQPVYFQIFNDTLVLHGASDVRYPIIKQTRNLFVFDNQNGDEVHCVLSDDPDDADFFTKAKPASLNQGKVVKRDTVVTYEGERYHIYVQVNPTTYKVIKSSYTDEGVAVDNVYFDNIVNLTVYHGSQRLFGNDFHKQAFKRIVPADFLSQSVLSDFTFYKCDAAGIHMTAWLVMPDDRMSSFLPEVIIDYNGKMSMKVQN